MKKNILSLFAICIAVSAFAQGWPQITQDAKPGTRWWWLGSAVDSVNLALNLEEYSKKGIGTVEITPIYGVQGNDANEIPYLSPDWMHMLRVTQQAAAKNGVQVDMNQGTGWPFGGPEVAIDDAACKAVFVIDTVPTGASPAKPLPEKEKNFATLIAESRRPLSADTDEVIRLYQSRTRQAVKRAAPGGEGYVIDHYDKGAVSRYLDKFDKAFTSTGTPWPSTFFNDSYEVYGANWTPTMLEEFEKRRGYRLQDKLPELLGHVDDGNQALCDYRKTMAELLLENFTRQWVQWCHDRGIEVRNQAHGSPANLIDLYAEVDIPEIEGFGLSDFGIKGLRKDPGYTRKNDSDVSMLKYASSAAHITGKPLTSAETFTWLTEHFRTSLSQMKPDLDLMFTCGVNHVLFHGTAYSPVNDPWPGWKFYASVDMSSTNSIWRDADAMMQYITRTQSFLQQGKPDNDFLVYLPVEDMWRQRHKEGEKGLLMMFAIHDMAKYAPEFIETIEEIDRLGYDSDYISDNYLMQAKVTDGMIETGGGSRYKGLVIPGSAVLPEALKAQVDTLRAQGAKIIFGVDSTAMAEAATPEAMRADLGLRALRRATDDGYIYFIANLGPDDIFQPVPASVDFIDALWFDPMSGDVFLADTYNDYIEMKFRSGESRILYLYNHPVDKSGLARMPSMFETVEIDLTNNKWDLEFIESVPMVKKQYKLKYLQPWTSLSTRELNELMGTGVYTTTFGMNREDLDKDWSIELGDVRESAKVYVNDKYVGTAWAAPFTLNINKALVPGKNTLRIEVTNLPANRIAAMDRADVPWRKFKEINIVDINYKKTDYKDWKTMPSGLNSTVKLVRR